MVSKTCPKCKKKSYSANKGKWICPYCGEDLSKVKVNKEIERKYKV